MTYRLPNLTVILKTSSNVRPFKVERQMNRVEHVSFGKNGINNTTISFTVVNVGRYKTLEAARDAASRSMKRHGGQIDER